MDPVNIYSVASQHSRWLGVRQSIVAQNVANANTPGYKAVDVEPFEAAMASTKLEMARTRAAHMTPVAAPGAETQTREEETWQVVHSGNNVSIEQELLKAGEVSGAYALNSGVVKAFHRMMMASSRS